MVGTLSQLANRRLTGAVLRLALENRGEVQPVRRRDERRPLLGVTEYHHDSVTHNDDEPMQGRPSRRADARIVSEHHRRHRRRSREGSRWAAATADTPPQRSSRRRAAHARHGQRRCARRSRQRRPELDRQKRSPESRRTTDLYCDDVRCAGNSAGRPCRAVSSASIGSASTVSISPVSSIVCDHFEGSLPGVSSIGNGMYIGENRRISGCSRTPTTPAADGRPANAEPVTLGRRNSQARSRPTPRLNQRPAVDERPSEGGVMVASAPEPRRLVRDVLLRDGSTLRLQAPTLWISRTSGRSMTAFRRRVAICASTGLGGATSSRARTRRPVALIAWR
jgi:hypothetical protein